MRARGIGALAAAAAILGALAAYAVLVEPAALDVTFTEIRSPAVDEPVRIAFVADMQRRDADPSFVARAVAEINGASPDIVAMGGDFVEASAAELPSIAPLRDVRARLGAFAVLANHDYGVYGLVKDSDAADDALAEAVASYLSEGGAVRVLRNEIADAGGNVQIAGLDSYWASKRNESTLGEFSNGSYRIALAHTQEGVGIGQGAGGDARQGAGGDARQGADLYLFGHTHCGQVRLPLAGSIPKVLGLAEDYDYRHYKIDGGRADVYTTCGLAPWPRLLNPPEVSIIDIVPA